MKATYTYFCDFWKPHALSESCKCSEKFNMSPSKFQERLANIFPGRYAQTLTYSEFKTIIDSVCNTYHK